MNSTTQASVALLREHAGGPLHYRQIASELLRRGWIESGSSDPMNSIHSILWHHVQKQGGYSWFTHEPGGYFSLSRYGHSHGGSPRPTWREAVTQVLSAAGRPMHADEIYATVVESGLKRDRGRKWKSRLVSNLLAELVREAHRNGKQPLVRRVSPGMYAARRTTSKSKAAT